MSDEKPAVEYRDVVGFPGYKVGSDGSVISYRQPGRRKKGDTKDFAISATPRVIAKDKMQLGYWRTHLRRNGRRHDVYVHLLVANAFLGPCPPGKECCHGDGNPDNNRLSNLRWGTRKENAADRVKHGRTQRGEKSHLHKLSVEQVTEVIRLATSGKSFADIASKFNVSYNTVYRIAKKQTWTDIPRPEKHSSEFSESL